MCTGLTELAYKTRLNLPVPNPCVPGEKGRGGGCSLVGFLHSCNGLDPAPHPTAAHSGSVGKALMPGESERQNISCGREFPELDRRQQSQLNRIISSYECFLCQRIPPRFQPRPSQACSLTSASGCQETARDAAVSSIHPKQKLTVGHSPR